MVQTTLLERIGLTSKESSVYLALIELGPSTVAAIAKKTGIHRPLIYKTLPGMEAKGLLTKAVQGKRQLYVAAPPETLEALFEGLSAQFHELVPQLRSAYETIESRPIVKHLIGKNEIATIFTDITSTLRRGDTFYRYSSAKDIDKAESYLPEDYRKRRDAKQLERLVIMSEGQSKKKKFRLERWVKVVPKDSDPFDQDVTVIIYSTKVAFIDYNSDTALVVENSKVSEFHQKLFMLLYKRL